MDRWNMDNILCLVEKADLSVHLVEDPVGRWLGVQDTVQGPHQEGRQASRAPALPPLGGEDCVFSRGGLLMVFLCTFMVKFHNFPSSTVCLVYPMKAIYLKDEILVCPFSLPEWP